MAPKKIDTHGFPTSTVAQARSDLFSPSTKGTGAKREAGTVISEWGDQPTGVSDNEAPQRISTSTSGRVIIKRGRLTQRHRDVLDAIMYCAKSRERVWDEKGKCERIYIEYDASEVLSLLRLPRQHHWLDTMLDDMAATIVELELNDGVFRNVTRGGLLTGTSYSEKLTATRKGGQFVSGGRVKGLKSEDLLRGGEIPLKVVILGPAFVYMFDHDQNIYMSKAVPDILALEYPISRAIARWMLSHSVVNNHCVDKLFDNLGVPADPSNRRKLFEQMKTGDLERMEKLNITLTKGATVKKAFLNYKPDANFVWVKSPTVAKSGAKKPPSATTLSIPYASAQSNVAEDGEVSQPACKDSNRRFAEMAAIFQR